MMRRMGYWLRAALACGCCLTIIMLYLSPKMTAVRLMPSTYYLAPGQTQILPNITANDLRISGDSVEVRASGDESISDIQGVEIDGKKQGQSDLKVFMFGMPVKTVSVKVDSSRTVVPGGHSIGVTLHTKGALVVGISNVVTADGSSINPGKEAGISPGDVILSVNDKEIQSAQEMSDLINEINGPVTLRLKNGEKTRDALITPQPDAKDGKLRMGLWVRDSTIGVGTLTFYDPASNGFGALGHAITDIDTQSKLIVSSGEIMKSSIIDVNKGERGAPGGLKGSFSDNESLGSIRSNTDYGIYGQAYNEIDNDLYPEGVPIALQSEVHPGPAEIISTIDDSGMQKFSCEIVRVQSQSYPNQRGMVFEITDKDLLNATGGIVQGMSGSPILQNGKLIGAVTHVFVNDPSRGYGMFIEWMLDELEKG